MKNKRSLDSGMNEVFDMNSLGSPIHTIVSDEICKNYRIQKEFYSDGREIRKSININTNEIIGEHKFPPYSVK
ncbi:MAG: hypothetical protein WDZ62_02350 [Candidatus Pacearchaeota archaeon]